MGAKFAPRLRRLKYRLRRRFWKWLRGRLPEEIADRIGALTLRYRVRTDIGMALYLMGSFEAAEIALMTRILRARPAVAPAIFDVGANIGVHSVRLCSLLPDAHIVAFEPAAATRRLLERNVRENGLAERIRVEACALSNARGSAQFYEMADDAYSSLKNTHRKPFLQTSEVRLETLDHYVAERGVTRLDLVKIDVEGFETEVIEGGLATLAALQPDLFVEIYQGTHSNADPSRTIRLITSAGYTGWVIRDGELHPITQHEDRYQNYFFSVRDVPAELARAAGAGRPAVHRAAVTPTAEAQENLAYWREAVRAEPETPGAYFHLGMALQGVARYEEAHGAFREALRLRLRGETAPDGPRVPVPRTTLVCVDCRNHELALVALRRSMAQCRFERVQLFTNRALDAPGIEVTVIPDIASIADYSRFMLKALADRIETDFALVVQYDGFVANGRRWRAEFLDYDYIGAPWAGGGVGNGGFSLRSRRLLRALQDERITDLVPEDIAICQTYRSLLESEYGIRFAPFDVAARFSFETLPPPEPTLGFHGLTHMVRIIDMTTEDFERYRPEPMVTYEKG